jgi:hypothetical protein
MNKRSKVSLAFILALGSLTSAATIIRIPYIYQLNQTSDFLFANVNLSIWSTIEPGMGITASSLACLKPLFAKYFGNPIGSSYRMPKGSSSTPSEYRINYFSSMSWRRGDNVVLSDLRPDSTTLGIQPKMRSVDSPNRNEEQDQEKSKKYLKTELESQRWKDLRKKEEELSKRVQMFGITNSAHKGPKPVKGVTKPLDLDESSLIYESRNEEGINKGYSPPAQNQTDSRPGTSPEEFEISFI